jgi:hypothetical protein
MGWHLRWEWALLILTALLLAWAIWQARARPGAAGPGPAPADPWAVEVAEFNRAVSDWRG